MARSRHDHHSTPRKEACRNAAAVRHALYVPRPPLYTSCALPSLGSRVPPACLSAVRCTRWRHGMRCIGLRGADAQKRVSSRASRVQARERGVHIEGIRIDILSSAAPFRAPNAETVKANWISELVPCPLRVPLLKLRLQSSAWGATGRTFAVEGAARPPPLAWLCLSARQAAPPQCARAHAGTRAHVSIYHVGARQAGSAPHVFWRAGGGLAPTWSESDVVRIMTWSESGCTLPAAPRCTAA